MKLYVIMDRATGRYLPHTKNNATYVEFEDQLPPRLFTKRTAAINAMRAWKSGYWHTERNGYGEDYEQSTPMPYTGSPQADEVAARRSQMDLGVIEVALTEVLL